jgi:N-acetyl-gamma-glutamyl-phosphate reductase
MSAVDSGKKIPAVVLGATGYVGGEFLRLIATHPNFVLAAAVSDSHAGDTIGAVFPHLAFAFEKAMFVTHEAWIESLEPGSDLALFSAAPHGASAAIIKAALDAVAAKNIEVHVVDASADFRYSSQDAFEKVYGPAHGAPELLANFSSGLPEHVAGTPTRHIGHPGCFATAMLLATVPLLQAGLVSGELFVSGITGSTGSGKLPQAGTHHPERHSNLYAYKPLEHRHAPEVVALAQAASGTTAKLNFVPHSGPFARGIHITLQAPAAADATDDALRAAFEEAYRDAAFIDVVDGMPKLKNVVASNRCQIGTSIVAGTILVTSVIDNLVKGAAGGSVQWMNRLWGLPEESGLLAPSPAWI